MFYADDEEDRFNEEDRLATKSDACREFAANVGHYERYKNSAWIFTDYDTWEPNPHYVGKPQSHPEMYDPEYD